MYCMNCGKQINPNDKFCNNCGAKTVTLDKTQVLEPIQEQKEEITIKEPTTVIETSNMTDNQTPIKKSNLGLILGLSIGGGVLLIGIVIFIIFSLYSPNIETTLTDIEKEVTSLEVQNGNGHSVKYDKNEWTAIESQAGNYNLENIITGSVISTIGQSTLYDFEDEYDFDFSTKEGKEKLYDLFYNEWSSGLEYSELKIFFNEEGFKSLDGEIYYATIQIGKNSIEISGDYYIFVSKEENIILTFGTLGESVFYESTKTSAQEVFDTLVITGELNDYTEELSYPDDEETILGYMDYLIPANFQYSEDLSSNAQYKSYYYIFRDSESILNVKATTYMNYDTGAVGATIDSFKNDVENDIATIINEDTMTRNNIEWNHIVTEDYYFSSFEKDYYNEYYVALSKSSSHLYMFELYIPSDISSSDKEDLDETMEYILENAELLKYDE